MEVQSPDRFSIACSIASFVVNLREAVDAHDVFVPLNVPAPGGPILAVEAYELGIHLQIRAFAYYLPVDQIEPDTFFHMDGEALESIVPGWMTA